MATPVVRLAALPVEVEGKKDEKVVRWLKHYSSAQRILIVGDGDFSFSRALVTAFGSGANLVATSLDSYGSTSFPLSLASRTERSVLLRCMHITGTSTTNWNRWNNELNFYNKN